MEPIAIVLIVVAAVVFGVVGFVVGGAHRKKVAEAAIGSATEEAARIVNNAMTEAEQKRPSGDLLISREKEVLPSLSLTVSTNWL